VDVLSDRDTQVEQYAGIQAKYERFATDRIRAGFEFDLYHEMYDPETRLALADESSSSLGAGTYRSRMNFEPSATFVLAKPLTLTIGLSFEELQPEFSAARLESANAVVNTLRYHQRWENSDATIQELDAGYDLRAATKLLNTDFGHPPPPVNGNFRYPHDH